MKQIIKNIGKEIARAILSGLLALIGIESVGCVACGDGAIATFTHNMEAK